METLATIAIYSIGVMTIIMMLFMAFSFGGFADIFPSKKRKSEEVEKV